MCSRCGINWPSLWLEVSDNIRSAHTACIDFTCRCFSQEMCGHVHRDTGMFIAGLFIIGKNGK